MKKFGLIIALTIALCLPVLCASGSLADENSNAGFLQHVKDYSESLSSPDPLPTIDEALQSADESETGIIEVSDDLSAYDPENIGDIDYGDFKMIVLQRTAPEKEFTAYDSGYPDNYVSDLPDDFTGIDIGSPKIWLRWDIMKQLPSYLQATSLEDADLLVIAENEYYWAGTLTNTDYESDTTGSEPEFDTIEEMQEYLIDHPKVISKITYYPKFGVYSLINFYDTDSKYCGNFYYTYQDSRRFARNTAAQDIWSDMEDLKQVMDACSDPESVMAGEDITDHLKYTDIPEEKISFWSSCADQGEYEAMCASMDSYYWEQAQKLSEADGDEDHMQLYETLISVKDAGGIAMAVNFYDYAGFDTPIEEIEASKEYMAETDPQWFEDNLAAYVKEINDAVNA